MFLAIVEFLSKLSESPEFEPVIKDLINEGKENLITMLNREQPDTGMDLLIRGHEKIGEFLKKMSTTICNDQEFDTRIWENDLNVWSLKILSKIGHGTTVMDKFKISKLLRLIKEQKTTCFTNSGSVYEALIILDQYFSHDPQINQVSNLDWLWQIFKHRDASIRIMGYQMASIISMTSLLMHTVAHSTRPSFMAKANNQPLKKFLSLAVS